MKNLIFLFTFIGWSALLSANPTTHSVSDFKKDPTKNYQKAKKTNSLWKLTLQQRIEILNKALIDAKQDSTQNRKNTNFIHRNDMVKDVITSTPEEDIRELVEVLGDNAQGFEKTFHFLPSDEMGIIMNYTNPVFAIHDSDSRIYPFITHQMFFHQLNKNIENNGDSLFQSHFTDFCGKVAVVRLWIKSNSDDYARFMTELYYNGEATCHGRIFRTPLSVRDAINGGKISEDPKQKVLFRNRFEQMPQMMDMVLYLTLASSFHTFGFRHKDYDPDKHSENTAWAGASINPELQLLTAMGFTVEKVGDNFTGISNAEFDKIISASKQEDKKKVMLLVNSSLMDRISGANKDYAFARGIDHRVLGTHWITVNHVYKDGSIEIWEYAKFRHIDKNDVLKMKKIVAGGIIIDGYGTH